MNTAASKNVDERGDSKRDLRLRHMILVMIAGFTFASLAFMYSRQWRSSAQTSFSISEAGKSLDAIGVESATGQPTDRQGRNPRTKSKIPDGATHDSKVVYFGTDRSRALPFQGTSITCLTLLTFAILIAAIFLWWRAEEAWSIRNTAGLFLAALWIFWVAVSDYLPFRSTYIHQVFGSGRADLQVGTCLVSIPLKHKLGTLEGPSLLRFELREDPDAHVVLKQVDVLTEREFEESLAEEAQSASWREALVFVHGYNNSFEDAARRAAQLSHDLEFGGITAFFSWPSAKETLDYTRDGQNAEYAWVHLKEFLQVLATKGKLNRIHIVAHSMGNQCLSKAMRDGLDLNDCRVDECILAAPDIDAQIFERDFAEFMLKQTGRLTLYASKNDHALQISRIENGDRRLGDVDPLTVVPGMESIDVSAVDTGFLSVGHASYGNSPLLIDDMRQMIDNDLPASNRAHMKENPAGGNQKFWELIP